MLSMPLAFSPVRPSPCRSPLGDLTLIAVNSRAEPEILAKPRLSFFSVRGFRDDLAVLHLLEQTAQAVASRRLVVNDQKFHMPGD